MRAVERDRLFTVLAWVYLAGLVAVSAYYLWPRSVPEGVSAKLDLSALPQTETLELDEVDAVTVRASITTVAIDRALESVIQDLGGDLVDQTIPIDRDEQRLLEVLATLRTFARQHKRVAFVLRFEPSGVMVRLHAGTFDDPGGRIGKALLDRKKRLARTSTTGTSTSTLDSDGDSAR